MCIASLVIAVLGVAPSVVLSPSARAEDVLVCWGDSILAGIRPTGHRIPFAFVNAQVGEDLVTNPSEGALPEELLLDPRRGQYDAVLGRSSLVAADACVLSRQQRDALRGHLTKARPWVR